MRNTNSKIEKNVSFLRKAAILQPKTIFWCFKVVCTLMHFGLKLRLTHKKDPYCMAQWEIYKGQPLCKHKFSLIFPSFVYSLGTKPKANLASYRKVTELSKGLNFDYFFPTNFQNSSDIFILFSIFLKFS